jgi:hypothetical protein
MGLAVSERLLAIVRAPMRGFGGCDSTYRWTQGTSFREEAL